jgi:hexosaminidase
MTIPIPALLPRPLQVVPGGGQFTVDSHTTADGPPPVLDRLREVLGLPLPPVGRMADRPAIRLALDAGLADEEYRLTVSPAGVHLTGGAQSGLVNGVHTVAQLLPPGRHPAGPAHALPCLRISDRPRFGWRGVMLDVARHFMPVDFVRRLVDLMALHRLNVLHLHLTDDQGWRVEIRRYPRLTAVGAHRQGTDGGFYTRDDVATIVGYAAARGITVVPEIDLPGHVQAALAAYPELGNDPAAVPGVWTGWGISPHTLNVEESTVDFFGDVLAEVVEMFPSPYVHIGGDECELGEWRASSRAQHRMRELGIAGEGQLHGWLLDRMSRVLAAHGRRTACWQEDGSAPPPGALVMPWRHETGPVGYDVVLSPHRYAYLDYRQSADGDEPPSQPVVTTLADVYGYQPEVPADRHSGRVLGLECALWTEYMPTADLVEYMAFPRMCAFAEVAWSGVERDYPEFHGRLSGHLARLDARGVRYRPLDPLPERV